MIKRVKHLVVDSGAFIKGSPVYEYAESVYTVGGVVNEIKDKATLERLRVLPYTLNIKEPSPEACKCVSNFSKKTGDYSNLSSVDLQLLALTYQLEIENVGMDHLRTEPSCNVTGKPVFDDVKINGFYIPKKTCADSIEELKNDKEQDMSHAENEDDASDVEDDDSDEESWLTPSNIDAVQKQMGALTLDSPVTVACITTDFCIQNVLIQMGLNVISVDGMLIKQTRVFILRCFSCYKTTNNTEKLFCHNCGNKTLKRVAVMVNEDGSKNIHINFRRPINIRGTRYSLPTPKGGKHAKNPVLCADQPIPQNRPRRGAPRLNVLNEDYVAQASPFATNDIYSRAASLGIRNNKSHRNRNPNEPSKCTGNRK